MAYATVYLKSTNQHELLTIIHISSFQSMTNLKLIYKHEEIWTIYLRYVNCQNLVGRVGFYYLGLCIIIMLYTLQNKTLSKVFKTNKNNSAFSLATKLEINI